MLACAKLSHNPLLGHLLDAYVINYFCLRQPVRVICEALLRNTGRISISQPIVRLPYNLIVMQLIKLRRERGVAVMNLLSGKPSLQNTLKHITNMHKVIELK